MKTFLAFLLLSAVTPSFALDLKVQLDPSLKAQDRKVLESVLKEASDMLPEKFILGLPQDLKVTVKKLTEHQSIPDNLCDPKPVEEVKTVVRDVYNDYERTTEVQPKVKPFIYGHYIHRSNTLTINAPVIAELARGRSQSKNLKCQHKSLYDQAVATIIHELTHAYDMNNENPSHNPEYIRRAGFKKGLLKIKNKNTNAMRSPDPYELVSIQESFAVNMEYFAMDPEFMCRKPSIFDFFKKHFGSDPYPQRRCQPNTTVMMSSIAGYVPLNLDHRRVYRVDYLLASAGKGIQSGFGHSMFRIVMCAPERLDPISGRTVPATPFGKKCLDDKLYHVVVSYRANVEDATLNYLKGLTGGYPSMLFILNFGDVLDEYNRDELRDVMSYPLALSPKEKEEFVTRVIEEHWNYRGDYKFITNNCAVESYDLLRGALERQQMDDKKSVTPNGVLEDLDRLEFTSMTHKEMELYKAKTDQLLLAYRSAYGVTLKGSDKSQKEAVLKFIETSKSKSRMNRFVNFQAKTVKADSLHEEVLELKNRLVEASSFSVMEQQILRTQALKFRKKAADKFMNTTDERTKKMIEETGAAFAQPFKGLASSGYGIPFQSEMTSREDLEKKIAKSGEALKKADLFLKEMMPEEYASLEEVSENIKTFNLYSLQVRKDFRGKLDNYILQVLKNMTMNEETNALLISAAEGNKDSLSSVRKHLGADLVTEKEILDSKLRKIIAELI